MRIILVWLMVLGVVPWVLRAAARGDLTVEQAGLILIGAVVWFSLPKRIMKRLTVFVGLAWLAWQYSHGDPNVFWAIFGQLMALAITLLGLVIMLHPLFSWMKTKDDD